MARIGQRVGAGLVTVALMATGLLVAGPGSVAPAGAAPLDPGLALSGDDTLTATRGTAFSFDLSTRASGGEAPLSFAVTEGSLPQGLGISGSSITGTPDGFAGASTFTVTVTDGAGQTASASFTVTVAGATLTITPTTLPGATVGVPYSVQMSAGPNVTFTTASTLPAGLQLSSSGLLSGTPTGEGVFPIVVEATSAFGDTGRSPTLNLTVGTSSTPVLSLTGDATITGIRGAALSYDLGSRATGGVTPHSFAVTSGSLPEGLAVSGSSITGTPTGAAGASTFTVTVTDGAGQTASASFTVTVAGATLTITPETLPGGAQGVAYSQQLSAGFGPSFTISAGTVPTGLGLSADGLLSGTPTASGTFTFTVSATNALGDAGSREYTLGISVPDVQPDVQIKKSGIWQGNDVYDPTGASQAVSAQMRRQQTRLFELRVQNDGARPARFVLDGMGGTGNFIVRYQLPGGVDVTGAVVDGTFVTPELAPGMRFTIRATVKPTASAPIGAVRQTLLSARGGVLADAARMSVTVKR